jgi:hypothetical protein
MRFEELLNIVEDEPVFETSLLLSGGVDPVDVRRQLSRWAGRGRLYQLRRGLYALAPPYGKVRAHPFMVANRMVRPSYVSLQSALAFHGLIPEHVPVTTSITTGRPGEFETALGTFVYRHVQRSLFRGFREIVADGRQPAFVATPEKALLDLLYLEKGSDSEEFLAELRLEIGDGFDLEGLEKLSPIFGQGKVQRAAARVVERVHKAAQEFEVL